MLTLLAYSCSVPRRDRRNGIMATLVEYCKQGNIAKLRKEFDLPDLGSDQRDSNSLDVTAWHQRHPALNSRHDDGSTTGHTLVEIAAANGRIGEK